MSRKDVRNITISTSGTEAKKLVSTATQTTARSIIFQDCQKTDKINEVIGGTILSITVAK